MRREIPLLLIFGLSIWILGTICYANVGPAILEPLSLRYWCSFALSPILSALLCVAIVQWRPIEPEKWASAILLPAIPGMIGEAVELSNLSRLHAKFARRVRWQIRSAPFWRVWTCPWDGRGGHVMGCFAGSKLMNSPTVDARQAQFVSAMGGCNVIRYPFRDTS
jgi:hypothetical protein